MGGLSAVGAGLYSLGIPKNSILQYETALRDRGKFVLIAHGSLDETTRAKEILGRTTAGERWSIISRTHREGAW